MNTLIVRPRLTKGAVAWANRAMTQYCKDIRWKATATGLRMDYGSNENMPPAAMEVILDPKLLNQLVEGAPKWAILRMSRKGIGRIKCIGIR